MKMTTSSPLLDHVLGAPALRRDLAGDDVQDGALASEDGSTCATTHDEAANSSRRRGGVTSLPKQFLPKQLTISWTPTPAGTDSPRSREPLGCGSRSRWHKQCDKNGCRNKPFGRDHAGAKHTSCTAFSEEANTTLLGLPVGLLEHDGFTWVVQRNVKKDGVFQGPTLLENEVLDFDLKGRKARSSKEIFFYVFSGGHKADANLDAEFRQKITPLNAVPTTSAPAVRASSTGLQKTEHVRFWNILQRDVQFLKDRQLVDYSFLVNASSAKATATATGCGIIDFFTVWTSTRGAFTMGRRITQTDSKIDVIQPDRYAQRMLDMFKLVEVGGGGAPSGLGSQDEDPPFGGTNQEGVSSAPEERASGETSGAEAEAALPSGAEEEGRAVEKAVTVWGAPLVFSF